MDIAKKMHDDWKRFGPGTSCPCEACWPIRAEAPVAHRALTALEAWALLEPRPPMPSSLFELVHLALETAGRETGRSS